MGRCVSCDQSSAVCACYADAATIVGVGTTASKFRASRNGIAGDWRTNLTEHPIDFADDLVLGAASDGTARLLALPQPVGANWLPNSDLTSHEEGSAWSAPQSRTAAFVDTVGATSTHTTNLVAFTAGDIPGVAEWGNYMESVVAAGSGAGAYAALRLRLFDVASLAGKTVTFSWWARASSNGLGCGVTVRQNFGAYSLYQTGQKQVLTTSWARYSKTFDVPSLLGQTITTDDHGLDVYLYWDAGSTFDARSGTLGHQSGTFGIFGWKLEEGDVATPYERPDAAVTQALADRHIEVFGASPGSTRHQFAVGEATSTTAATFPIRLRSRMRKTPSLETVGSFEVLRGGSSVSAVSVLAASSDSNPDTLVVDVTTTGLTAGQVVILRAANDATARLKAVTY